MDRKLKFVFQLDSPFTMIQWPQISPWNQEIIVEVLCSLLSPIGQHRADHITSSKGKRSKKRKRQEVKSEGTPTIAIPSPPELSSFLALGLNSITRTLQYSAQVSRPKTHVAHGSEGSAVLEGDNPKANKKRSRNDNDTCVNGHFSAIFIYRPTQATILHEHLPLLIYTASLAYPNLPPTRLVELPSGAESRISKALGIPRVSSFGILEGAPHSTALIDLVRKSVPEIEIPWLQQARESKYLPVKINAIETFNTVKKDKA